MAITSHYARTQSHARERQPVAMCGCERVGNCGQATGLCWPEQQVLTLTQVCAAACLAAVQMQALELDEHYDNTDDMYCDIVDRLEAVEAAAPAANLAGHLGALSLKKDGKLKSGGGKVRPPAAAAFTCTHDESYPAPAASIGLSGLWLIHLQHVRQACVAVVSTMRAGSWNAAVTEGVWRV